MEVKRQRLVPIDDPELEDLLKTVFDRLTKLDFNRTPQRRIYLILLEVIALSVDALRCGESRLATERLYDAMESIKIIAKGYGLPILEMGKLC